MALSKQLGDSGMNPESIHTTAAISLNKVAGGFAITDVQLEVMAKIPGADEAAKAGCPVSKVLNATITMNTKLEP